MLFTVITVAKNSAKTIARTIESVRMQSGIDVEHIVKDGGSTDGTLEIARSANPNIIGIEAPDEGIYDAMNQAFYQASGDVIAYLNSDDYYPTNDVLSTVNDIFNKTMCGFVYGDIRMINSSGRVVRDWRTKDVSSSDPVVDQIPHPALFVKRELLAQISPPFDASYKISADLKQQLILHNVLGANGMYIPRVLVIMQLGGRSTRNLGSYMLGWKESVRAYRETVKGNPYWLVTRKVLSKVRGVSQRLVW